MDTELYEYIYQIILAYLPAVASIITGVLTFVKLISAIKSNKADNIAVTETVANIRHNCDLLAKENAAMAAENRELRKTVQKLVDKIDTEV